MLTTLAKPLLALVAVAAACLNGCSDEPVGSTSIARDSANVRIVDTRPQVWPPPEVWRVDETPSVEIGVREGKPEYELFQVQGVVGLPDGGFVIAEFGARLRYYDARGVHVRTLERRGEGPGEAGAFSAIGPYRGDSLYIITEQMFSQRSLTRLIVLASDGTFGRNITAWYQGSGQRSDDRAWFFSDGGVQAAFGDGSFVVQGATRVDFRGSPGDLLPGRTGLLRLSADGVLVDTIANVTTGFFEYRPMANRKWEMILGDAESPSVRTRDMDLYSAKGDRFEVDVYAARPSETDTARSGSMQLTRSFRVLAAAKPSTSASREEYISSVLESSSRQTDADRAAYRKRLESLRSPDSVPAVRDLQVDALGNIWLEVYQPPGVMARRMARSRGVTSDTAPSTWIVLDDGGRLLGSVFVPAGLEVTEIGNDYVMGISYDEFGVQRVRRHPITKKRPLMK